MVSIKDLWAQSVVEKNQDLQPSFAHPSCTRDTAGSQGLDFQQSGAHVALVIDKYGTVQGIVTLHDILEMIVGDLPSSELTEDSSAVRRDDGSWLIDGLSPCRQV